MASWQVQTAKTRFSELLEDANTKGPQIITRHGTERAVVLSAKEYRRLAAQNTEQDEKPNFIDFLLSGPQLDRDDPFFEAMRRHVDPERDLDL